MDCDIKNKLSDCDFELLISFVDSVADNANATSINSIDDAINDIEKQYKVKKNEVDALSDQLSDTEYLIAVINDNCENDKVSMLLLLFLSEIRGYIIDKINRTRIDSISKKLDDLKWTKMSILKRHETSKMLLDILTNGG